MNHMRQIFLACCVLALSSSIGLTGCASPAAVAAPEKMDPAAVSLDQALSKKAALRPAGPEVAPALPTYSDKVSVSFLGDASTLLSDAAKGRGTDWTFQVTGPQPRLPIYVQVNVKEASFQDFLRGVAEQLGQRADIALNGKSLELRYRAQN